MLIQYFKNKWQNKILNSQGFTMVEVVTVQVFVGILAAISLPNMYDHVVKARQTEAQSYISTMNRLQQAYFFENATLADSFDKLGFSNQKTPNFNYTLEYKQNEVLHHGNYQENEKYNLVGGVCINPQDNSDLIIIPPQEASSTVILDCNILASNTNSNPTPITNNNPPPITNNNPPPITNNNPPPITNSNPTPITNSNPTPITNQNNNNNSDVNSESVTGDNLLNDQNNIIIIGDNINNQKEDNQKKVTICHKGKEITIASSAVSAHLNHGDKIGSCQ